MSKGGTFPYVPAFALLTLFYIGVGLYDGPVWCVDSPSYESMDFSREPVYPLFLLALRKICELLKITAEPYGQPAYLTLAIILQSILWIAAALVLGKYVFDISARALSHKRALVLSVIAMGLQVAVSSLNRFAAGRGSMYSESIMTESLAMPLFVIFTVLLLRSLDDYDKKKCLQLAALAVLMGSIRKQMLIVLIMWGFASFVLHLFVKKYRSLNKFSYTVIAVVVAFFLINILDCTYNLAVRGVFAGHTGNSKGGLCTLLYTADYQDAVIFEDSDPEKYPEITLLYSEIYNDCVRQKLTIDYAPGYELKEKSNVLNSDWISMASHYAESYDVIGFDIVLPRCDEYVSVHFPALSGPMAMIKENEVEAELFKRLLKNSLSGIVSGEDGGVVYVFTANLLKAMVISNANISPRVLVSVSFIIYIIFFVVFVLLLVRTKALYRTDEKGRDKELTTLRRRFLVMSFVVMSGLMINCVVTGSMIFPQPRYMCYSMGLFYLALSCDILCQ